MKKPVIPGRGRRLLLVSSLAAVRARVQVPLPLSLVLAVAALAGILAFTAVRAADDLMTGLGSPTACLSANVTGTVDSGAVGQSMDLVTVQAGAGNVVSMVCIKTGADIFPLGGAGDCANIATNIAADRSKHSPCITADGQYADGPCYAVAGLGTATVTVARKLATCPAGSGISHVDFLAKADPGTATPTNTPVTPTNTPVTPTNTPVTPTNTPVTPTNTPVTPTATLGTVVFQETSTPTPPSPVGGVSLDPQLPGSSGSGAGLLSGIIAGAAAGAVALGGGVWYARLRRAR